MNWLKEASRCLCEHGITEPEREALLILSYVHGITPGETLALLTRKSLEKDKIADANRILQIRCQTRKPLPYIIGEWEFFGMKFLLDESVFIPRPETELLVEAVLDAIPDEPMLAVDVGTGCGNVAIAILAQRKNIAFVGVDVSQRILAIALRNAVMHNVANRFFPIVSDMLSAVKCADIVVSNPPYIPTERINALDAEVQAEPKIALDGGTDGMDFVQKLLYQTEILHPKILAFEFGSGQKDKIRSLIKNHHHWELSFMDDIAKIPRVAIVKIP